jgi:hypothetical protein
VKTGDVVSGAGLDRGVAAVIGVLDDCGEADPELVPQAGELGEVGIIAGFRGRLT